MRVRKETGDFSIKFTASTTPIIPKGLTPTDLLGAVIEEADGSVVVVSAASAPSEGVITLTAGSDTYSYTVATGGVLEDE